MTYRLVRSLRRRRSLSLRILPDHSIEVRAPLWTPQLVIDRFVAAKSGWIAKRRSQIDKSTRPAHRYFTDQRLKTYIGQELAHYSARLKLTPTSVRYKRVRSYWGNCSPKGVLSFNLRLAHTPPQAVSYVIVHELVHLKYKGHNRRFWALVNHTYPEASEMRKLLGRLSH